MLLQCSLVLVSVLFSACAGQPNQGSDLGGARDVTELTSDNFEGLTQASTGSTSGNWFVMFYAPWCGHCKKMAPQWEAVAAKFGAHSASVAKVDCTTSGDVCRRFGVRGYPTLLFFARGKFYRYSGKRDADSLVEFVQSGWQSKEGDAIPPPLTLVDDIKFYANIVLSDVRMLYEQDPQVFIGGSAVLFIFFVVVAWLGSRPIDEGQPKAKSQ